MFLRGEGLLPPGKIKYNIKLEKGLLHALLGPNGVGKSSWLKHLKKTHPWEESAYFIDQFPLRPLGDLRGEDYFKMLCEFFEFERNLSQFRDWIEGLRPGLSKIFASPLNDLSGGENQLVKLLIGLNSKTDLLFCDEPFNNLDSQAYELISKLLISRAKNSYLLVVSHDQRLFQATASKLFHLNNEGGELSLSEATLGY